MKALRALTLPFALGICVLAVTPPAALAATKAAIHTLVTSVEPKHPNLPTTFPNPHTTATLIIDGSVIQGGPGGGVRQWYGWLNGWLQPWFDAGTVENREIKTLQKSVVSTGNAFMERLDATTGASLAKFNKNNAHKVTEQLKAYVAARRKEEEARSKVSVAIKRCEAATSEVKANTHLVKERELTREKNAKVAKMEDIRATVRHSKEINEKFTSALGTVVDLAGSITDPVQFGMKTFGKVTGWFLDAAVDEHETELFLLTQEISALDKAIAQEGDAAAKLKLDAARKLLDAAIGDVVTAILEEQRVREEQNDAIDFLAKIERGALAGRDPSATNLFVHLQKMHLVSRNQAAKVRKATGIYQNVLTGGPGRRVTEMVVPMNALITEVSGWGKPEADFYLETARHSRDYMEAYGKWFTLDVAYTSKLIGMLDGRLEAKLIDAAVTDIQAKY